MPRFWHADRDPFEAAAEALQTFRSADAAGSGGVLDALLGHRLDLGKHGHLVDGPLRLVVLTPETIVSADPHDGRTLGFRAITELAGYFASTDGKLLTRFDEPNASFPSVAAFRPLASGLSPGLSAQAAGYEFLRRAIDAWEAHTGARFVNSWSPASHSGGPY